MVRAAIPREAAAGAKSLKRSGQDVVGVLAGAPLFNVFQVALEAVCRKVL
ncbi:hypothetical protein ACOM2C_03120 [Pseudarthrobacter sp. So.54]